MDLKSSYPFWLVRDGLPHLYPALEADARAEVAIVGSGITGALVAHALCEAGLQVIVLDRRPVGTGSTSASTCLLQYELDTPMHRLARLHGAETAARAYRLGLEAVDQLDALVRKRRIDCDFKRLPSLYLASDLAGKREIEREFPLRLEAGFETELLDDDALRSRFGIEGRGALFSSGAGQVDAYRLAHGIFQYHQKRGALRVFERTEVVGTAVEPRQVRLRTRSGFTVRAGRVVMAPGYEAAPFLPKGLVRLRSTYALASEPMREHEEAWPGSCLVWETARPYFYARTTADRRLVVGGEDQAFRGPKHRDSLIPRKQARIEQRFRRWFPDLPLRPAYAWAGVFGESLDGMPYIGPLRQGDRVLFALGYGGNGITFSQIAADLLRDLCRGRKNPDAALFRFDR